MFDQDTQLGGPASRFPDTQLTVLAAVSSPDAAVRRRAMESIVAVYWKPVYKHIRIQWRKSNEDAKDLTQGFFARVLERDVVERYQPELGSFRHFLRTCLDRFVSNDLEATSRLKRGGREQTLSLDFESAEGELSRIEPASGEISAEDRFYREWVRSVFSIAVTRLCEQCASRGKQIHFELFERYDLAPERPAALTYDALGREFGLNGVTVTNYLAAMRRDFRRAVLDTLRELTCSDVEFRAEARRLLGVEVD